MGKKNQVEDFGDSWMQGLSTICLFASKIQKRHDNHKLSSRDLTLLKEFVSREWLFLYPVRIPLESKAFGKNHISAETC